MKRIDVLFCNLLLKNKEIIIDKRKRNRLNQTKETTLIVPDTNIGIINA